MKIAVVVAATATLALGGCGIVQQYTGATPAQQIAFVKAVPCVTSTGALAAQGIEAKTINGKAIADQNAQDITTLVYLGSASLCALVGGIAQAPVTVAASAVSK